MKSFGGVFGRSSVKIYNSIIHSNKAEVVNKMLIFH